MKSPLRTLFVLQLIAASALATEISTTELFTSGQTGITHANLNNIIAGATINVDFYTGKSAAAPTASDVFLYYDAETLAYKKATMSSLQTALFADVTLTGATTISGATSFSGDISPSQITSDQNNYAPTGFSTATTLRLSTDASRNLTGLAGGGDGRTISIHNVGSFNIVLKDESGSSTAGNRFALTADLTIVPDQAVWLQYDSTSSRWRLTGTRPSLKSYLQLAAPSRVDGTGAVMQTTTTATYNGQAKFSNSADQAANYAEYRFIVPTDLDTAQDLKARLKVQLSNTDTGTQRYVISVSSVADSAAYAGSLGNAVNLDVAADASGASGDVEGVAQTTLTGWKSALTAGQLMVVRLARDGDAAQDASTVDSYSGPIEIEYTPLNQ